jgi:chaperone modulatory protein CbpM
MTSKEILTGLLLDQTTTISLRELSRACTVHAEFIVEMVEEGILQPRGEDVSQWRFSGDSLQRTLVVIRLQRDLGVNLAGAALVLDLMEEIANMRARLHVLESGIEEPDESVIAVATQFGKK